MELSAVDPWGAPATATVASAGPSPPPTVPGSTASNPWAPAASTDPWGVTSPTSPTSSDPWGGGPQPTVAPPPDPWGETSNKVNNVDPWGGSGKSPKPVILKQNQTAALENERRCENLNLCSSLFHGSPFQRQSCCIFTNVHAVIFDLLIHQHAFDLKQRKHAC